MLSTKPLAPTEICFLKLNQEYEDSNCGHQTFFQFLLEKVGQIYQGYRICQRKIKYRELQSTFDETAQEERLVEVVTERPAIYLQQAGGLQ